MLTSAAFTRLSCRSLDLNKAEELSLLLPCFDGMEPMLQQIFRDKTAVFIACSLVTDEGYPGVGTCTMI